MLIICVILEVSHDHASYYKLFSNKLFIDSGYLTTLFKAGVNDLNIALKEKKNF